MCTVIKDSLDSEEYASLRNDMRSCRELASQLFVYSLTVQAAIITITSKTDIAENVDVNSSEIFNFSHRVIGWVLIIIAFAFLVKISIHKMEQFYIGSYIKHNYEKRYSIEWINDNRDFKGSLTLLEHINVGYSIEFFVVYILHSIAIAFYFIELVRWSLIDVEGFSRVYPYFIIISLISIVIYFVRDSVKKSIDKKVEIAKEKKLKK